jgi:hypothetical protein
MVKPAKLKDMVLRKLDRKDPAKAEAMYDNLSNDDLIDLIAGTVFTGFGIQPVEQTCSVPDDFEDMGELNQYNR